MTGRLLYPLYTAVSTAFVPMEALVVYIPSELSDATLGSSVVTALLLVITISLAEASSRWGCYVPLDISQLVTPCAMTPGKLTGPFVNEVIALVIVSSLAVLGHLWIYLARKRAVSAGLRKHDLSLPTARRRISFVCILDLAIWIGAAYCASRITGRSLQMLGGAPLLLAGPLVAAKVHRHVLWLYYGALVLAFGLAGVLLFVALPAAEWRMTAGPIAALVLCALCGSVPVVLWLLAALQPIVGPALARALHAVSTTTETFDEIAARVHGELSRLHRPLLAPPSPPHP